MSQGGATRRLVATIGIVGLFAGYGAMAQGVANLPPGSVTYPIHFATGASKLEPGDQDTIRAVAAVMQQKSELTATIIGKADTQGSAEFNERLAQKRAQEVFDALVVINKIPENRVEMRFTGEHLPVVATSDEEAERQNRVVAIILR